MEHLADHGYSQISVTRVSAEVERTMVRLSFIVTIIAIALACVFAEELYTDKYDDVDLDEILTHEELRLVYYNCFIDTAPCQTPDAKFFRDIVAEAIQTDCKKCTEKQKWFLAHLAEWYEKNQPEQWEVFLAKRVKV